MLIQNLNMPKTSTIPQFIISIQLITENFEYALKSEDQPK